MYVYHVFRKAFVVFIEILEYITSFYLNVSVTIITGSLNFTKMMKKKESKKKDINDVKNQGSLNIKKGHQRQMLKYYIIF